MKAHTVNALHQMTYEKLTRTTPKKLITAIAPQQGWIQTCALCTESLVRMRYDERTLFPPAPIREAHTSPTPPTASDLLAI